MFNPLKFLYNAKILSVEEDEANLELKMGAKSYELKIPKALLPPDLKAGDSFILKLAPTESAKQGDYEIMKKLLQELIN